MQHWQACSPTAYGSQIPADAVVPNRHKSKKRRLPDVEYGAPNHTPPGPSPAALKRTNTLAWREIARLEAAQVRADIRAASRDASIGPVAAGTSTASTNNNGNGNSHMLGGFQTMSRA